MIVGGRPTAPWNEGVVGVGEVGFPGNGEGAYATVGDARNVVVGVERGGAT